MVLIFISLKSNKVEYFFMFLLAISISSIVKCLLLFLPISLFVCMLLLVDLKEFFKYSS